MEKISTPVRHGERSYRGFNLFYGADPDLFRFIVRGEFTISKLQARTLRPCLQGISPSQLSHMLKRLRTHGLIKKIGRRYKYYLAKPSISRFSGELHVFTILHKVSPVHL